jgi:hypothetical protein
VGIATLGESAGRLLLVIVAAGFAILAIEQCWRAWQDAGRRRRYYSDPDAVDRFNRQQEALRDRHRNQR